MLSQRVAVQKKVWNESGSADRSADLDIVTAKERKQSRARRPSAFAAPWHIEAFWMLHVSLWLPHPCAAPAVYCLGSQGDDSGFSITVALFPSFFIIVFLFTYPESRVPHTFLHFKSVWRLVWLLRWSGVSDAKSSLWVIAQEGACCSALSDPVSHSCQFSRLAGPYCLRDVTRAVRVNLMLMFMFAGSLELRTPASVADRPLVAAVSPRLSAVPH